VEIQSYLRILRARWKSIVVVTVLAVLGGLGASLLTTPIYAASTQLFVSTSGAADAGAAYTGGLYSQQRVASYSELLKGTQLAQKVVDQLGLPVTATQLAAEVSVQTQLNTVLLNVTVSDPSPQRAQNVANALSEQFTRLVTQLETPQGGTTANATVTVTQAAGLPNTPVTPKTLQNLALAALVGLALGVGLALLRDRLDSTVKERGDIAEASGAAVIGAVPYDSERPGHPLITFGQGHSTSAEAYRQIRTNLQFLDVDNPPRVIVVTSAIPGEGKTVTALNLAFVLAEAGKRVVLVEADLRRPRVTRYLKLLENVGLTNVLAGSADLDDVLQATVSPGVTVLGSGPHPPNPSELLGSSHTKALLQRLRQRFEYVIIDAPPLLPVTDAAVLSTVADGALLVTRHGHTKLEQLARATDNLRSVDAKILGAVLNMVPAKAASEYEYACYLEDESEQAPAVAAQASMPRPRPSPLPNPRAAAAPTLNGSNGSHRFNGGPVPTPNKRGSVHAGRKVPAPYPTVGSSTNDPPGFFGSDVEGGQPDTRREP